MAKVQSLESYLQSRANAVLQECTELNAADLNRSEQLRINVAILYLQLQQTVTSTEFSALHTDDVCQIEKLKASAAQVYTSIVSARKLGTDYLFAAFTYFSMHVSLLFSMNISECKGCSTPYFSRLVIFDFSLNSMN